MTCPTIRRAVASAALSAIGSLAALNQVTIGNREGDMRPTPILMPVFRQPGLLVDTRRQ